MFGEINQTQKNKYVIIPTYMRYLKQSNSQKKRVEQRLPGPGVGVGDKGVWELLFEGYGFFPGDDSFGYGEW